MVCLIVMLDRCVYKNVCENIHSKARVCERDDDAKDFDLIAGTTFCGTKCCVQ